MSGRLDLRAEYPGFRLSVQADWTSSNLVLFGGSGSGKSTIVEAICGLRRDVRGLVRLDGRTLQDEKTWLAPARRSVGWVPQDGSLFPHLDVRRNLTFGLHDATGRSFDQVVGALELESLLHRRIVALSGGERQRVAAGRAVLSGASTLLLDEPLASLDTARRAAILHYFLALQSRLALSFIWVSHDPREVAALGGTVAIVDGGAIVELGTADAVFATHRAMSVLEGLGAENRLEATLLESTGATGVVVLPGGTRLSLPMSRWPDGCSVAQVHVRAEDLLVANNRLSGVSARNQLVGVVDDIRGDGEQRWLTVDVDGNRWIASVTATAIAELGLAVGSTVWLILKATAIHPVP
jgi:molybdate transport system ATP-binding protein